MEQGCFLGPSAPLEAEVPAESPFSVALSPAVLQLGDTRGSQPTGSPTSAGW